MHNVTENSDCCRYCHKSYFNTRNTKYHEKLLAKFCTKQEFERSTNRSWSISGRHFVHQSTRVWRSPIPVYRRSRRFGGKITKASVGYPASDKICKLVSEECRFSERAGEWFTFQRNFFILKTGATQWRVGVGRQRRTKVREAGERGTRSRRLWPPVPPPNSQESSLKDTISAYGPQNSHPLRYITDEKQQKRTGQLVEINICGTVVARILVFDQ